MNYKKYLSFLVAGALSLSLIGCAAKTSTTSTVVDSKIEETAASYNEAAKEININDKNDTSITISEEGTYRLSGKASNLQILVEADKSAVIRLILAGVDISNENEAAILVEKADKVYITLEEGSENSLSSSKEDMDGVIYAKTDLIIDGEGEIKVTSASKTDAIVSKDNLIIEAGNLYVESGNHGIKGKDSITVNGGYINITSDEDGLHASNSEDENCGTITINGGQIEINAEDDGIHAESSLTIEAGTINITNSYEGLEATVITINGGDISVTASDDGLNAASSSDSTSTSTSTGVFANPFESDGNSNIIINGGNLHVTAQGDGIDSNGDLTVNGGIIYVDGPTDNNNAPLDFGGTGTITGGTVIAVGSSGMAQNFGSDSTQPSIMVNANSTQSGDIILTDDSGNVIVQYSPVKNYNSVVISCADLVVGNTYNITMGEYNSQIELTDTIYGSGMEMGGFGGFGGGKRQDGFGQRGNREMQQNGEAPEMPQNGEMPEGFEMPQNGEMPEGFEMPQNGEMPQGFGGPENGQMPGENKKGSK